MSDFWVGVLFCAASVVVGALFLAVFYLAAPEPFEHWWRKR